MRITTINATRTSPPTAAPGMTAIDRDLESVGPDRDDDVADGRLLTVIYAVGWALPSPRLVGTVLEVKTSKDAVAIGSSVKETSGTWDVVVGVAVDEVLVALTAQK
jgi:hypothetical protein